MNDLLTTEVFPLLFILGAASFIGVHLVWICAGLPRTTSAVFEPSIITGHFLGLGCAVAMVVKDRAALASSIDAGSSAADELLATLPFLALGWTTCAFHGVRRYYEGVLHTLVDLRPEHGGFTLGPLCIIADQLCCASLALRWLVAAASGGTLSIVQEVAIWSIALALLVASRFASPGPEGYGVRATMLISGVGAVLCLFTDVLCRESWVEKLGTVGGFSVWYRCHILWSRDLQLRPVVDTLPPLRMYVWHCASIWALSSNEVQLHCFRRGGSNSGCGFSAAPSVALFAGLAVLGGAWQCVCAKQRSGGAAAATACVVEG